MESNYEKNDKVVILTGEAIGKVGSIKNIIEIKLKDQVVDYEYEVQIDTDKTYLLKLKSDQIK